MEKNERNIASKLELSAWFIQLSTYFYHTVVCFQVFLTDINELYKIIKLYQEFLSNTKNLYSIKSFKVTLPI